MSDPDDGFLGRWSRRKRAADRADAPATAPQVEPDLAQEHSTDALQDPMPAPDDEPLTEAEIAALPKIADLVEGSDVKVFLRAGVPRALRNAALRKIWMLTPAIRDYKNPAVDYAWDWNTPGGVPGDGVAPSLERSAQMLHDLLAPRTAHTAIAPEPAGPEMVAEAPTDTSADAPVDPSVAIADQDPLTDDAPPGSEAQTASGHGAGSASESAGGGPDAGARDAAAGPQMPAPARQRHGGALPS